MTIVENLKNYFIASYAEMKKVTWPTKNQTINYSLLVISMSVGLALFFALLDYALNLGVTSLLNR
ncbi:MAG: preprotein translocase subunit SecE [Candidatus Magasanikbacteria bacterium RIFCSPLOWO2_02_FULL_44_11]|uniref:Protein translocase subunit SecE n=2 Tax=Candidatus Magasanikiibacteriota TaxID=1752731 RepID=A0A1F6NA37_9BACT|nr:MAG: preprotein translocase subunit SecE [Candidatus Magasanikbacteria bacterium RIFCSPHIGHO2_02_FULL_45_10]OGH80709.1 MAG: preprotein translocase subunit SecE [Candidatus Magasanikbacteria bacterium RIFCSPLOWO2_02_FULL_44_11]